MGFDPISLDQLVERSGESVSALSSVLLRLELDGIVENQRGGRYLRLR
jgi:DNA processing protein